MPSFSMTPFLEQEQLMSSTDLHQLAFCYSARLDCRENSCIPNVHVLHLALRDRLFHRSPEFRSWSQVRKMEINILVLQMQKKNIILNN